MTRQGERAMIEQRLSDLGDPRFIAVETFRKSGKGVRTPVWTVARNGGFLVPTSADSWKVKRARNNPRVRVAACDAQGNTKGPWVEGVVLSISGEAEVRKEMRNLLKRKYPFTMVFVSLFSGFLGRYGNFVVMEIGDEAEAGGETAQAQAGPSGKAAAN